jgi:hypothetical protein
MLPGFTGIGSQDLSFMKDDDWPRLFQEQREAYLRRERRFREELASDDLTQRGRGAILSLSNKEK